MIRSRLEDSQLYIGKYLSVSFERTLRIPDDGKIYPLPPSFGSFPLKRVEDYASGVPSSWKKQGGVFFPMYQREALWIYFSTEREVPIAVKVAVGKINALSGKPWNQQLHRRPQDYVVCPDQPWLDGINAGSGLIRQFVAVPLGQGLTVEGQLTGKEEFGGIQLLMYQPKKEIIRKILMDEIPERILECCCDAEPMGLGAGGKMKQKIYPDERKMSYWDQSQYGRVFVHIVNSEDYKQITGVNPPASPISAQEYIHAGFPWFDLYDAEKGTVEGSAELNKVKSVPENPMAEGLPVFYLKKGEQAVTDGKW